MVLLSKEVHLETFEAENFHGLLTCTTPKKLSQIATKPQNSWKFSPSKVSRYTVVSQTVTKACLGEVVKEGEKGITLASFPGLACLSLA